MSGGVDSSVTAALLKERGFKVVGVHLKCWNIDGCAAQDAEDARRAAESLDIPFYVFDFEQEYRDRVVEYMVDGYRKGITPNPDVVCNQEIKFGLFYKRAMSLGADFVATGHYVRLGRRKASSTKHQVPNKSGRHSEQGEESIFELYAATDKDKDQSYFLWTLTQKQLAHCLFPLGDFIKRTQVRKLAKKYKLPNATKKDSQGICFLGQVSLPEFLSEFIPQRKGAIINAAGKQVGEHQGAYYYTIGQRRGLGVGGSPVPLYVAEKDVKKNTITVAPEGDESLLSSSITLSAVNLINSKLKHSNILQNVGMSGTLTDVKLPVLALLISGGHTEFVLMKEWFKYEIIGETLDDAVGEAFDKVARMLGLGYPGGPIISKLAAESRSAAKQVERSVSQADGPRGSEFSAENYATPRDFVSQSIKLPRPMLNTDNCDVSFSGLKTAALYALRDLTAKAGKKLSEQETAAFAREFEDAVTDVFIAKTRKALEKTGAKTFVIGGGVAANTFIRNSLQKLVEQEFSDVEMRLPELSITGDNAIMIAEAALARTLSGLDDSAKGEIRAIGNLSISGQK